MKCPVARVSRRIVFMRAMRGCLPAAGRSERRAYSNQKGGYAAEVCLRWTARLLIGKYY